MNPRDQLWRKCAITALSALLFFQAAGWVLAYRVLQLEAKTEAKTALRHPETPLYTVTIPVSLLPRIRVDKKEVRLDGQLFDIKDQRISGDSVTLTLYHDRPEEKILQALGGRLAPGAGAGSAAVPPLQYWLSQWLGAAYLLPLAPEIRLPAIISFQALFHCLLPVTQTGPGRFSPPPEG